MLIELGTDRISGRSRLNREARSLDAICFFWALDIFSRDSGGGGCLESEGCDLDLGGGGGGTGSAGGGLAGGGGVGDLWWWANRGCLAKTSCNWNL